MSAPTLNPANKSYYKCSSSLQESTDSHCLTSLRCYQLPPAGMTAMQKLFNSRPMGSLRQAADSTHLMPAPKCCQSAKGTFNIGAPIQIKNTVVLFLMSHCWTPWQGEWRVRGGNYSTASNLICCNTYRGILSPCHMKHYFYAF